MKGESVEIGKNAFIQDGEVKGNAAELAQYEVEV